MKEEQIPELHLRRINLRILISIITLSLTGFLGFFLFDERVISWLYNHPDSWLRIDWLRVLKGFGKAWLPIWLLFSWICVAKHRQQPALVGLLALLLIAPVIISLKALVYRPRPNKIITTTAVIQEAGDNNDNWWSANLSFPSGDTAVVFAVATALAPFVNWPWVVLFFTVAGIVGLKRVTSLNHYPSDVFAGAIIGIFSAWLALQIILRWLSKFKFRRGHAAVGVIIIPIALGVVEGTDKLLIWLKTYGLLVAVIFLIANAGAQTEEFRRIGHWLFRWRSFLPLLTILPFLIAFKNFAYPEGSHTLDILWEILCFAVSFSGLGIRIYTIGHTPKGTSGRRTKRQKAEVLNTTGIYSVVRHPLYLGNFLIWFGMSLFIRSFFFSLAAILLFFLYYERIIFAEEDFLRERFGQTFNDWAEKTSLMFPHLKKWRKPSLPFSPKTALKREYTAFFVIIAAFTCLEVIGDFVYKRKWQISWFYALLFFFGLVVYITLRALKKKGILDVEGR